MQRIIAAAKTTAAPGISDQVVNELRDAATTAKTKTSEFFQNLPSFLTRLAIAAAVLIALIFLVRFIRYLIRKTARRRGKPEVIHKDETSRSIIASVVSYIGYFIAVGVFLSILGLDITQILAAAGVVGIAIAFGAQTMVKDLLAGLLIWGEKSITIGDVITVNDLSGTVEAMSIRTTTIRNFNGNVYIIPNGDIRAITNMSRGFKRAIVNVPCPYEENQERLVAMVKEEMEIAALEIEGIKSVPEVMSIVAFEPNSVTLQIAVPCPVGQHWRVERDIRSRVKARFDKEGIIMPHYNYPKEP
ncbi:MAG: mechanosensitive ion channel family protein [Clostridia bacterium]|nr:mechanosensitive ion channel family protein [Clostridia bacterium]